MERLAAASISLLWAAAFAGLSLFALLAADRGVGEAVAAARLPISPDRLAEFADRPIFGGLCLGAAIVSALFATVAVSSALNGRQHLGQDRFIADMAFGGAFGLALVVSLAMFLRVDGAAFLAALFALCAIAGSFPAMRWAMREERVAPLVVRRMAIDAAAASSNIVAFPAPSRPVAGGAR